MARKVGAPARDPVASLRQITLARPLFAQSTHPGHPKSERQDPRDDLSGIYALSRSPAVTIRP
jgi:hypothetical protein